MTGMSKLRLEKGERRTTLNRSIGNAPSADEWYERTTDTSRSFGVLIEERTVTGMAEIGCKKCTSPDCKGCNTFILETALKQGRFDALMDGNRTLHIAADVRENVRGRWKVEVNYQTGIETVSCSNCHIKHTFPIGPGVKVLFTNYCPNCGAQMGGCREDGDNDSSD